MKYQQGLPSTTTCSLSQKLAFLAAAKDWFLNFPCLHTVSNTFNAEQHCSAVKSCLYFICLLFLHIAAGKSSCQRISGYKHGPCRCWPQAQLLPSQPDVAFCSVALHVKHVDNGRVYMGLIYRLPGRAPLYLQLAHQLSHFQHSDWMSQDQFSASHAQDPSWPLVLIQWKQG